MFKVISLVDLTGMEPTNGNRTVSNKVAVLDTLDSLWLNLICYTVINLD